MGGSRREERLSQETLWSVSIMTLGSGSYRKQKKRKFQGPPYCPHALKVLVSLISLLHISNLFLCASYKFPAWCLYIEKEAGQKKHSIPPSTGLLIRTLKNQSYKSQ